MDLGLKGKVAVVTGASRGMGKAVAHRLAAEGAQIAICGRSPESLLAAADEIESETGARPFHRECDLASRESIDVFMAAVEERYGGFDILVANAGGPPRRDFPAIADEEWEAWFALTFMSVVRLARRALPVMARRGGGRIVTITSSSVERPIPNFALSNALRPAVLGLVRTLASEAAPFGILVNNFSPGRINTERARAQEMRTMEQTSVTLEEVRRDAHSRIPLRRYGDVGEVADAVAFMVSQRASYLTGTTILLDGGLTASSR